TGEASVETVPALSPNIHDHSVAPVDRSVNCTAAPASGTSGSQLKSATGTVLITTGPRVTFTAGQPPPWSACTVTVYAPSPVKQCCTRLSLAVLPSPKSQL